MKLSLDMRTSLTQTLTPQQIQYLKLLQLPVLQLEQQVMQEIEQNPMLEETSDADYVPSAVIDTDAHSHNNEDFESPPVEKVESHVAHEEAKQQIDDNADPFEFYNMLWQDDSAYAPLKKSAFADDDDNEPYQIKDNGSFVEELVDQLRLLPLPEEYFILGTHIIGNIDADGYLRRELMGIVDETNLHIIELNFELQEAANVDPYALDEEMFDNPARQFEISDYSVNLLEKLKKSMDEDTSLAVGATNNNGEDAFQLKQVNMNDAVIMLGHVQELEPAGIGSRNIQECLVAQCRADKRSAAQKLALEILTIAYDPFTKKHYNTIIKQLGVSEEYLKESIDYIRRLNPKPGGGDFQSEINTVIPDFLIGYDEEKLDLIITVNDSRMPNIQLSTAFEKLKKEANFKKFNKDTKNWIRNKYEDAKFLIQAIRQRKSTMLKVMTAIAAMQRNFFDQGQNGLKPLIYKDIAESTGLDISTVCRIVNGKYVQTEFGTYELKFFFSESLPTDEGEEVSTRVIKQVIKVILDEESKKKPLSDEKISKVLKEKGYNVARRTVAKYREQLKIPVARLRKEL